MVTHSSILAGKIPWTEEPGGLWPVGSQRGIMTERERTHTRKEKDTQSIITCCDLRTYAYVVKV